MNTQHLLAFLLAEGVMCIHLTGNRQRRSWGFCFRIRGKPEKFEFKSLNNLQKFMENERKKNLWGHWVDRREVVERPLMPGYTGNEKDWRETSGFLLVLTWNRALMPFIYVFKCNLLQKIDVYPTETTIDTHEFPLQRPPVLQAGTLRYDRHSGLYTAFFRLGCSIIIRFLQL